MKKSVFLAAFGLTTSMASSHGQGFVLFSSYTANGGVGAITSYWPSGGPIGIPFQAYLYYAFGTVSDPVNFSSYTSISSPVSSAFTLLQGVSAAYDDSGIAVGAAGLGYFDGGVAMIPGYTGGPITFEVVVVSNYYPAGYQDGRSGAFTMDSIAGPGVSVTEFGDNGQPMPDFVAINGALEGPEPSTLALAGLGGLVSLVMFRRKLSQSSANAP